MSHKHTAPAKADNCCSTETGLNSEASSPEGHHHDHDGHDHAGTEQGLASAFIPSFASLAMLIAAIALDNRIPQEWFTGPIRLAWYLAAYAPVGLPVVKDAFDIPSLRPSIGTPTGVPATGVYVSNI